jgi:hypothetical protein
MYLHAFCVEVHFDYNPLLSYEFSLEKNIFQKIGGKRLFCVEVHKIVKICKYKDEIINT